MNRWRRSAASLGSTILDSLPWVYAFLVVISSLAAEVGEFDDALPLIHGILVQLGATPTIDFRSFYPPLGPYVTAAAFNLLGRTVIATRILNGVVYILVLVLLNRILARRFQRSGPTVAMTLVLLAAALGRAIALPAWPGFGLSAVALLVYFLAQEDSLFPWLTLALSGALTGLALLYRVNFGGYVVLVVAADLMIDFDRIGWRRRHWRQPLFNGATFVVPMLACLSTLCLGIYGNRLPEGIAEFTLTSQKIMLQSGFIDLTWSLPLAAAFLFPPVWFFLYLVSSTGRLSWRVLPAFAFGFGLLTLAVAYGQHASVVAILVLCELAGVIGLHVLVMHLPRLERGFLFFYVLQLHYYLSRADIFHWKFLPFAAVLLLALLWPKWASARGLGNVLYSKGIVLAGFIPLIWFVLAPQSNASLSRLRYGVNLIVDVSLHRPLADADRVVGAAAPGEAWSSVYSAPDELRALRHLQRVTTNADPIFVGVQDHSRVFFNDLRIYWLSGRRIGVREFQLEDRIATEEAVQREIIHDLDQNHVNWAVIDCNQPAGDKTFVRRAYSGSTLLDSYLLEHFKEESRFGQYAILRRVGGSLLRPSKASPSRFLSRPEPDSVTGAATAGSPSSSHIER